MLRSEFLDEARRVIYPGFVSFSGAVQRLRDLVEDSDSRSGPASGAHDAEHIRQDEVPTAVEAVWTARLAEQRGWADRTDSDRLADAFSALDAEGVQARMNYQCCTTCATEALRLEFAAGDAEGDGFVYFHEQGTDALVEEPATLYLGFGADSHDDDAARDIGRRVVDALRTVGLRTTWSGSETQKIAVEDLWWRKRLPALARPDVLLTPAETADLVGVEADRLSAWAKPRGLYAIRTPDGRRLYSEREVLTVLGDGRADGSPAPD